MWLLEIIRLLLLPIFVVIYGILFGLLYKGIDRKLAAHFQARIGPPVVQPFRDVAKLFIKESIVPENSWDFLFNLMPIICLVTSCSILLYLPLGLPKTPFFHSEGDLILIIYLFMLPALTLVIGGLTSGSPYATIGAQREMLLMLSYEFPLAISIVALAWKNDSFSIIAVMQNPIWSDVGLFGFIGAILLLMILLAAIPVQLAKVPFDIPEAETEIAGGITVEYSGRNLALFYLGDAVKTIAIGALTVALFFPYNLSKYIPISNALIFCIVDFLFFLIKLFVVIFISVIFVRVAAARLKIDQIPTIYWVSLTTIGFVGILLLMIDKLVLV